MNVEKYWERKYELVKNCLNGNPEDFDVYPEQIIAHQELNDFDKQNSEPQPTENYFIKISKLMKIFNEITPKDKYSDVEYLFTINKEGFYSILKEDTTDGTYCEDIVSSKNIEEIIEFIDIENNKNKDIQLYKEMKKLLNKMEKETNQETLKKFHNKYRQLSISLNTKLGITNE